ncbi:NUDIX hydrolase [Syntrophotalea acetylenivorans]|uniref:NUDIX hydrolase n=1 Tax=Syntrophotalea acetylenivorans TaxID=1842532 RepID=A0A1L3GM08_9BACT|nr:NUDIX domain-containing protein [Syntrophotalea acetylenivorans]APG26962.1 NUDIX hydrolase [Syntrophotalea acetylenivorans]
MEELFDIVDDQDRVIGQAPRSACHGNPALIHRVAHVLVFNSAGQVLLQKRSRFKDVQPGRWDTSVGGHLDPGEDYLAGALREMAEELGIINQPLELLYSYPHRNTFESENVTSFWLCYDGPVHFDPKEIEAVAFYSPERIAQMLGSGFLTPNFEHEWSLFLEWESNRGALTSPFSNT